MGPFNPKMPAKANFLLTVPKRFKVLYGGRGSAKSYSMATALLVKALQKKRRILCCRLIQNSIKDSLHRLLSDLIDRYQLNKTFTVNETEIRSVNGSLFLFKGLKTNINEVKSLEGIDILHVAEAQDIPDPTWGVVIPTIRNPESEIWIDFNVNYDTDDTYKKFVLSPPDDCISVEMNFYDNPWLPDVLKKEAADCQARDPIEYENVWLGKPRGQGGKIWTTFDPSIHVKEYDWTEIRSDVNCFMSMDPHSNFLPFCLWGAWIPEGTGQERSIWIYNEWPTLPTFNGSYYSDIRKKIYFSGWGTMQDLAKEIYARDLTGVHGVRIHKRFIDSRYAAGTGTGAQWSSSTLGILDEFAKKENGGFNFDCPYTKVIDVQRQVIIKAMSYNKMMDISEFNHPTVYIAPHCKNLLQSLKNHRHEDGSEKEDEKFKDPSDALRILFAGIADWRYSRPGHIYREHTHEFAGMEQSWMA